MYILHAFFYLSFIQKSCRQLGLFLFLLCMSGVLYGQQDSTKSENLERAQESMTLFNKYLSIDLDSASYFAEYADKLAFKIGDSLLILRSKSALAYIYQQRGSYDNAVINYNTALDIARNNNFVDRQIFILNNLGNLYYNYGKYDEALKIHFESLRLRELTGTKSDIAVASNNIGLVYYAMRDFTQAISFFKRTEELEKGNQIGIVETFVNLGLCYSGMGLAEEALEYYERVIDLCQGNCDENILVTTYNGAGSLYMEQDKEQLAEDYFIKALDLSYNANLKHKQVISLYNLSSLRLKEGDIQESLKLIAESQKIALEINYRVWIYRNYKLFGQIYSTLGNYKLAYTYQRKHDSLNNIILNEEVIQNLAKIQINYQERENIETINLQRTELTRRTTLLILSIIIIFLAIIIVFMLFKNNRHRKNVNRKLSEANDTIEKQNLELTNMNHVLEERVRERTQELKASNAALLKSNTDLDNFIYKTSHDIRGPLATLQGMCNVALIDIKEPRAVGYFNKLATTAQRLNEILSKLLVINQINNSLISEESVNIESLLREVIDQQQELYGDTILVKEDIESNLNFRSDVDLVKLIISNLITNAFKFHNTSDRVASFVHISVNRCGDNLCLQVTDNGIGIDDKVSSKIFEIFSKASDMSDTAGLGLYLAKLAVEKLGGEIELSKTREGHTCFSVKIPGLK